MQQLLQFLWVTFYEPTCDCIAFYLGLEGGEAPHSKLGNAVTEIVFDTVPHR